MLFSPEKIRQDFPILKTGLIYFDSASSSLTPEPVLQKMLEFYHEYRANVGRGVYRLSQEANEEYERARAKVAGFVNAKSENEIIMTKNTTEGINTVASGLKWEKGDKIVISALEHHSNYIVWLRLKKRFGVEVEVVMPKEPKIRGILELSDFEKAIDDKTKLVAVTHASNVLGTILPTTEIAKVAHEHDALMLIDAAQSAPHMKVDVRKIGCDFLAFSGHKMCGPTGCGVLFMKGDVMDSVEPLSIGGGSIEDVEIDDYRLNKTAKRFEGGTPPVAEVIGLGAAVDYLQGIGMENIEKYEKELASQMHEEFCKIPKIEIYGPPPKRKISILPFNVGDLNSHDVALALDVTASIMTRSGHHCALPLMKAVIKKSGLVRASTYFYNTREEVDKLVEAVRKIAENLAV
ncbi:MAG TPA: cysteine desulfurase [Candidatus Bathyarchaeia archaeon]|nr:cysteine desulfurase [Candidatus Bathyarchaeia archaeon]